MRVLLEGVSKTFADRTGQAVEALSGVSFTAEAEELLDESFLREALR